MNNKNEKKEKDALGAVVLLLLFLCFMFCFVSCNSEGQFTSNPSTEVSVSTAVDLSSAQTHSETPDEQSTNSETSDEQSNTTEEFFVADGLFFELIGDHVVVSADDDKLTEVIIPAEFHGLPVTEVAENGFKGLKRLKTLVLPEGLEKIGDSAFEKCTALTGVTLPESLTQLGKSAFYACSALKDLKIGHNLAVLPDYCFYDCDSLTEIVIPEGVKEMHHAFGNSTLKGMTVCAYLPSSVEIMDYAFSYSIAEQSQGKLELHLSDYEKWFFMPTSKTEIEASGSKKTTFFSKQQAARINLYVDDELLTEPIIPNGCTEIPKKCFAYISSIKSAHLPEGLLTIGDSAFQHSGLQEIVFSSTVKYILQNAFDRTQIKELTIPGNVLWFAGCFDMPVLESIKAEEGLLIFGRCNACPNLKTVELPSSFCSSSGSLTYFDKLDGYDPAGDRNPEIALFIDCPALESVVVPDNNKYYGIIGGAFYAKIEKVLIWTKEDVIPDDPAIAVIGQYAYHKHDFKNRTVVIPGNITKICFFAFEGSNVKTFIFSEGVQILQADSLKAKAPVEVVLPKSLTEICTRLFGFDNKSVSSIYFSGSVEDWQKIRIMLSDNETITTSLTECDADLYFYSETEPSGDGYFWHYNEKGEIEVW